MAPLLLVAVGAIVATRAGLINIGQEGQLLIGACFGGYVAVRLPGPGAARSRRHPAARRGRRRRCGPASPPPCKVVAQRARGAHDAAAHVHRLPAADVRAAPAAGCSATATTARNHINSGEQIPFDTRLPDLDVLGNTIDSAVVLALGAAVVVAARARPHAARRPHRRARPQPPGRAALRRAAAAAARPPCSLRRAASPASPAPCC